MLQTHTQPVSKREQILLELDRVVARRQGSRLRRLFHDGYNSLVYSSLLRFSGRLPSSLTDHVVSSRTFFGHPIDFVLSASPDLWAYGMYLDPAEIRFTKFLIHAIKPGSVVFDIGAQFGFYSLLAAELAGPRGTVFSFEPCPIALPLLRRNTVGRGNIQVVPGAVASRDGHLDLHYENGRHLGLSTTNPGNLREAGFGGVHTFTKSSVPTVNLDRFCRDQGLVPDVIKIDIEGGEADALLSARELLASMNPIIGMEVWVDPFTQNYRDAIDILFAAGFSAYGLTDEGHLGSKAVDELLREARVGETLPKELWGNLIFKRSARISPRQGYVEGES